MYKSVLVALFAVAIVVAQAQQLLFPPPVAWMNANSVQFSINALGQQTSGTGSLQFQASSGVPTPTSPSRLHSVGTAQGATIESGTNLWVDKVSFLLPFSFSSPFLQSPTIFSHNLRSNFIS